MTYSEHIRWCKERAMKYFRAGDLQNAIASMLSDLGKHDETRALGAKMAPLAILYLVDHDSDGVRRFIEGFRE